MVNPDDRNEEIANYVTQGSRHNGRSALSVASVGALRSSTMIVMMTANTASENVARRSGAVFLFDMAPPCSVNSSSKLDNHLSVRLVGTHYAMCFPDVFEAKYS